ncbi:hypothetical protein B0H13DRAFT_1850232 [Mycena leptocephala]|nr:hypothetical protein B0H13DRAFT_1850232 [Mycena leptocephala]
MTPSINQTTSKNIQAGPCHVNKEEKATHQPLQAQANGATDAPYWVEGNNAGNTCQELATYLRPTTDWARTCGRVRKRKGHISAETKDATDGRLRRGAMGTTNGEIAAQRRIGKPHMAREPCRAGGPKRVTRLSSLQVPVTAFSRRLDTGCFSRRTARGGNTLYSPIRAYSQLCGSMRPIRLIENKCIQLVKHDHRRTVATFIREQIDALGEDLVDDDIPKDLELLSNVEIGSKLKPVAFLTLQQTRSEDPINFVTHQR